MLAGRRRASAGEVDKAKLDAEDRAVDLRLGANVRLRRKMLGMTQSVLADHLGLTFQQIQKYERGVNRIAGSTLLRIAGALNCTVDDLFEGAGPPAVAKIAAGGVDPNSLQEVATEFLTSRGGLALASAWQKMSEANRSSLLAAARAFARSPKGMVDRLDG